MDSRGAAGWRLGGRLQLRLIHDPDANYTVIDGWSAGVASDPASHGHPRLLPGGSMTTTLCTDCSRAPHGEAGHDHLENQLEGPYPGHRIFRCRACGERWIRHYGFVGEKHAWTRYDLQFI